MTCRLQDWRSLASRVDVLPGDSCRSVREKNMRMTEGGGAGAGAVSLPDAGECARTSVASSVAPREHVFAYRASIPVIGKRYYFAFFCGREERAPSRLATEGQRKSWLHLSVSASGLFLFAAMMLMSGLATMYLAKSMLGIDLFDDHFFLHNLFFN